MVGPAEPIEPSGEVAGSVAHAWAFLSVLVAMREALDVSDGTALLVCLLSLATAVAVVAGAGAVLLVAFPAC